MTDNNPANTNTSIEDNLDDGSTPEVAYRGGTLSLNSIETGNLLADDNRSATNVPTAVSNGTTNGNFVRGRPQSAPLTLGVQSGFYASKVGSWTYTFLEVICLLNVLVLDMKMLTVCFSRKNIVLLKLVVLILILNLAFFLQH